MSERVFCDPPEQVWIVPTDPADLAPLPAILHTYTEHEIIVSEYDRKSKQFLLAERERRTTACKTFEECRQLMLQRQRAVLLKAKEEYRNQASVFSHLDNMPPAAYPEDAFKSFTAKPEPEPTQEEEQPAPQEQVKPATQRPSRRRR
jgi:hypothetical protein